MRTSIARRAQPLVALAALSLAALAWGQTARVVLRWKAVPGAASYELEIAADGGFKEVVVRRRLEQPGYRWGELPTKTYYWRVRSVDHEGRASEWSQAQSIAPAILAPEPTSPPDGADVACSEATRSVELALAPSRFLKAYRVEVSADPTFSKPWTLSANAPKFELPLEQPGPLYWRAFGTDLTGRETSPSPPRRLTVRLGAPKPRESSAPLAWPASGERLRAPLAWGEVPCASGYRVEVTRAGARPVRLDAHGTTAAFSVPAPGEYRWRVAALGSGGAVGEWSAPATLSVALPGPSLAAPAEVRALTVDKLSPLSPPEPLEPAEGAVIPPGSAFALAWKPTSEAASYEVALDGPTRREASVTEPRLFVSDAAEGEYSFRVRGLDREGVPGEWSAPRTFLFGSPPIAGVDLEPTLPLLADGETSATLSFRLLDGEGRSVRGVAPEVRPRAGRVLAVSEEDGIYRVRYRAPAGRPEEGTDSLTISGRGYSGEVRVPLAEPTRRLSVGARLGWNSNLGALSSPYLSADVTWRVPFGRERLSVSGRVGLYGGSAEIPASVGLLEPARVTAQVAPVSALLLLERGLGGFSGYVGLGPSLQLSRVSLGGGAEVGAALGAHAVLGLGRAVGAGQLSAEVGYLHGRLDGSLAALSTGGLNLAVGYRLEL